MTSIPPPAGSTHGIDVFVIGAMKAATTGMCDWLGVQPGLTVCEPKEPAIFVSDEAARDWSPRIGTLFPRAGVDDLRIDGSTDYAKAPAVAGVPARVARHNPEARIVYLMRHPVERAISQYRFEWLLGGRSLPFERALEANPSLVDNGRYAFQLEQWLEHFGPDRFLLAFSESFFRDTAHEVGRVRDFLGLDPDERVAVPPVAHSNETAMLVMRSARLRALRGSRIGRAARALVPHTAVDRYKRRVQQRSRPEVSESTRARLHEVFDRDLERLRSLTGGPALTCETWHETTRTWTPALQTPGSLIS